MLETNKSLASYKIPSIFWNYIHHSPPLVSALNQMNLVHALSSYFFKIYFIIISPSVCWFSKQALLFMFFTETPCIFCYYTSGFMLLFPVGSYYRVRQKYLTIWQHSCEWNHWCVEFVLARLLKHFSCHGALVCRASGFPCGDVFKKQ
jgi:hypothetical protein